MTTHLGLLFIWLQAALGQAVDAFNQQEGFICSANGQDYLSVPVTPACSDGLVYPGYSAEMNPNNHPGFHSWTQLELDALARAAAQWSNAAGQSSAIEGAINWDFTLSATSEASVGAKSAVCDDVNDVYYVPAQNIISLCGAVAACVVPVVDPLDTCSVVSVDILVNEEEDLEESMLASQLIPYTAAETTSLEMVLLHELGHVIGLSHDTNTGPNKSHEDLISTMNAGDHGGGDHGGKLRIGPFEYYFLAQEKGESNAQFSNVTLRKFRRGGTVTFGTLPKKLSTEVWNPRHESHEGAVWKHHFGVPFEWNTGPPHPEKKKGPYHLVVSVNAFEDTTQHLAFVEWFLLDPAETECNETSGVKIGEHHVNSGNPLDTLTDYRVGQNIEMEVPCAPSPLISVDKYYRLCARLTVTVGAQSVSDDVVFSDSLFKTLVPTPGAASCNCSTNADCPGGLACKPHPLGAVFPNECVP